MTDEKKLSKYEPEVVLYCSRCHSIYPYNNKDRMRRCAQCLTTNVSSKLIKIDKDIGYTISALNQKGYITRFSCQGHPIYNNADNHDACNYNTAYVTFDGLNMDFVFRQAYSKGYDMDVLAAPDGWHWQQQYFGADVIYSLRADREYCNNEKQPLLMESIYKWAVSLPDVRRFTGYSTFYDWFRDKMSIIEFNTTSQIKTFKKWDKDIGYNSWVSSVADSETL